METTAMIRDRSLEADLSLVEETVSLYVAKPVGEDAENALQIRREASA